MFSAHGAIVIDPPRLALSHQFKDEFKWFVPTDSNFKRAAGALLFGMIIMLQLRLSPNRAKCISVLLVAFHAATECTSISGYQAKRRSLQAICDTSLMPYLLSSESCGHFPSAVTNPARSSPLLAGVLDNISLELCEPFNPKSGTPRSLERQGEGRWTRAASRVIDFESYPQSSYESPLEPDTPILTR